MKEYRDITEDEGAVIQEGDEVFVAFLGEWAAVAKSAIGKSYEDYGFIGDIKYRRPIEDTTTYSSDTINVLAKLAGLTDATTSENEFENEQDKPQEWVNRRPPLNTDCFVFINGHGEIVVTPLVYDDEIVIYKNPAKEYEYDYSHFSNFRQIPTEQTAEKKTKDEIRGLLSFPTSDDEKIVNLIFDWHVSRLKESGND